MIYPEHIVVTCGLFHLQTSIICAEIIRMTPYYSVFTEHLWQVE